MADSYTNLDNVIKAIENKLSRINNDFEQYNRIQSEIIRELQKSSSEDLNAFKNILLDSENELKNSVESVIATRENSIAELKQKLEDIQNTEANLKQAAAENDSRIANKYAEKRAEQLEKSTKLLEKQLEIEETRKNQGEEAAKKLEAQFEIEEQIRQKHNENIKTVLNFAINSATDIVSNVTNSVTGLISSSINNVANAYEQNATKLSTALNTSVGDISRLQSKIASALRDEGLNAAISNIQVLTEAANLTSAGYTDVSTLQQSALDISIGKQLAPNLDFSNQVVKNLVNIFGSDFATKFTAIQAATQETAGSVVSLSSTVSALFKDLEPVFTNAELSNAALQGTSDVSATLSAAREQGYITETQQNEYLSMITELMDPSKAFTSKNTAVKVAAQSFYNNGVLTPDAALSALLSATKGMYSNVGQSMSASDVISRSLFAGAMGMNTMQAAYMPSAYNIDMVTAGDLGETYEESLSKLQSGAYTTTAQKEKNITENSAIIQKLSEYTKEWPILYKSTSAVIITTINSLPRRLASALRTSLFDKTGDSGGLSGGIGSLKGKPTGLSNVLLKAGGLMGAANILDSVFDEENTTLAQKLSSGGSFTSSMTNWTMLGAGIGSFFPGFGTLIGGIAGAAVGLGTALWANVESQKKQTEATEEQTKTMEKTLGEGVSYKSVLEAQATLASGGGTVSLRGGTAALDTDYYFGSHATGLDYVPYDNYLANLHKGEAVVTADAANSLRKINPNFWNTYNVNNNDVVSALEKQTQSIVSAVNKDYNNIPIVNSSGPKLYTITA